VINLAKNISPGQKGLMGFISFGGLYFCFGGLKLPPSPCLVTSLERKGPSEGSNGKKNVW